MVSCEICEIFKNTYFEEHLQTGHLLLFHRLFSSEYVFTRSTSLKQGGSPCLKQTSNRKYLLELLKRRSKVHQKKNLLNRVP